MNNELKSIQARLSKINRADKAPKADVEVPKGAHSGYSLETLQRSLDMLDSLGPKLTGPLRNFYRTLKQARDQKAERDTEPGPTSESANRS